MSVEITFKDSRYRASHVTLPGDEAGWGGGRHVSTGVVYDVMRRATGYTTRRAFGVMRTMTVPDRWVRVRKPSVGLKIAFFNAVRAERALCAATTGGAL